MIRQIDIRLNAAHPDLPLAEAVTYTGAPSTVLIRGVPGNCGRWAITAVFVAATYPDGSTTTRLAVQSANGVWVATIPATATSGRTAHGLRILADGADENGEAVSGYILGVADFAVASLGIAPAPAPGETSYQMLYFDAVPVVLRKGDVAKIDGVLKFYNGTAWEAFATLDNTVTRTSSNAVKSSGIWSALWGALIAIPTGFSSLYDWCVSELDAKRYEWDYSANTWVVQNPDDSTSVLAYDENQDMWFGHYDLKYKDNNIWLLSSPDFDLTTNAPSDARTLTFSDGSDTYTLTRASRIALDSEVADALSLAESADDAASRASRIATQAASDIIEHAANTTIHVTATDKATWNGKQDALTAQQLANIEAVPNKANRAANPTAGNLAALDANGNPTNSTIPAANVATKGEIRYDLVTKTPDNGVVILDDHAQNIVSISSALATLTIAMPTATPGKVRDCGLRINIAAGITAPEVSLNLGETGGFYTTDGEIPVIADGGADGAVTILYFTEIAANQFLVKAEALKEISQQ